MVDDSIKMTVQEKADLTKSKIAEAIQHTSANRRDNRRKATTIKVATVILSAAATILLGLQIAGLEKYFKDVAFVFSTLVTLLAALEPYFNYRALWVEHELALSRFHRLRDELDYYVAGLEPGQLSEERLGEFYTKYQDVWSELSSAWIQHRRRDRTS